MIPEDEIEFLRGIGRMTPKEKLEIVRGIGRHLGFLRNGIQKWMFGPHVERDIDLAVLLSTVDAALGEIESLEHALEREESE